MAGSRRGVIGGFAVLAIVLIGLAWPRRAEAGAKEGAVQDATLPGPKPQLTVDLGGGVTMELILIPAGTFDMGSVKGEANEKPVHKVTLKKPFYIGKYEVSEDQWQAVMGTNPSYFKDPKKPVKRVSWHACRDFVAKLSEKTGRKFSLPSEAEWEYACRAGSTTEFCYGDGEAGLGEYAWHSGNSENTIHLVGQKKPNQFGLFDMHGNVWEWCEDVLHDSYEGAPADGSAWVEGGNQAFRVLRGGSWHNGPSAGRSAVRFRYVPSSGFLNIGCRVVLRDF
jgi:formylglycine-generating enzyme required for sulfatase activity